MLGGLRDASIRVDGSQHERESWRSPAQVDIDRVLYSPEFRRLAEVTQVVPPQVDYQFHDRLTHSVKVAQVASTLARQLVYQAKKVGSNHELPGSIVETLNEWVDPDYCYVAGLAHDIGHPPFGHAGEQALQRFCENVDYVYEDTSISLDAYRSEGMTTDVGDQTQNEGVQEPSGVTIYDFSNIRARSFEGNAQSTRITAALSFRKDLLDPGLNLTLRSMAAIAKYPWIRGEHPKNVSKLKKKWSFYKEEEFLLNKLREKGFVKTIKKSDDVIEVLRWPEAEIMDWADDISYAVHDLEDFFRAGLIPLHQLFTELGRANTPTVNWYTTDFDFVVDDEIRDCLKYVHKRLRRIADQMAVVGDCESAEEVISMAFGKLQSDINSNDVPRAPFSGSKDSHIKLQNFASCQIRYLSSAASLSYRSDQDWVQLHIKSEAVLVAEFYKSLNKVFVIESAMLSCAQYGQSADLDLLCSSLFDLSVDWISNYEDQVGSRRLPPRLREYLSEVINGAVKRDKFDFVLARVIDYVCSLGDFQASKLALQLSSSSDMAVLGGRWLDT